MAESIKVRKIGKYILKEKLGEGSMGSVWLSHHSGLNLPVAIKLLDMSLAEEDPDFLNRFMQEGRLAGQLNHKNIVRIYDAGMEGNAAFIAMEHIEGCDTLELLEARGALPPDEVLGLAIGISEALQEAHSLGIIHRDIKPDNILATTEGRIKLADLGLAKQMDDNLGGTMAGTALGTPYYIAPEQALDAIKADARSDIYSLGATLYHLLTGVVPFSGDNPMGVMLRHTNEALIPPQKRKSGLPISFCNVICKMMEKKPDDRYQNCQELHADLIKLKYGHDDVAEPSEKQLRNQLASGKSIRVKMKINPSEKYSAHNNASKKKKKALGSKKKKNDSSKKIIVAGIVFIALLLLFLPSLMKLNKKEKGKEKPEITFDNKAGNSSVKAENLVLPASKEEPVVIDNSKVINLLANNGQLYFDTPSKYFIFENNHLYIDDLNERTPSEVLTREAYENYRLTVEYRFLKDKSDGGIHFHLKGRNFFEVQCSLTETPKSGTLMARGGYSFVHKGNKKTQQWIKFKNVESPMGEWTQLIIESRGNTVKTTMNGTLLYEVEEMSNSKGYISVTRWRVCKMEYRKIELEKLDQSSNSP